MERRAAFEVVDRFEEALCEFTGAPYAVTTDSCTNALFLCLKWMTPRRSYSIGLPKHTYVGVAQAVRASGNEIEWTDDEWVGSYKLGGSPIVDSAKQFHRGMYGIGSYTCVSFQAGKLLPIGRGGAILHDNPVFDKWTRQARLDGRTAGADYQENRFLGEGYHMYMTPPDAARGLWLMTYLEDDDQANWTEYPDLSEAEWV